MSTARTHKRQPSWATIVLIAGGMFLLRAACTGRADGPAAPVAVKQAVASLVHARPESDPLIELARREPTELLQLGLQRCQRDIQDYSCVFLRQERVNSGLTAQQAMRVYYRDQPRSVYMTWIRNTDRVSRALYVQGRYTDADGQELALVEPAGAVARLLVPRLKVPIHGEQAQESSRHTIDQFGFRATLERITEDNRRFAEQGVLDCRYAGEGLVEGRPTFVLVRHLPYTGPDGAYPDARQVMHLDRQWLVPLAIYSYADRDERVLLGSYITTGIELNPGLGDDVFRL